jgi:hypothetical protein
LYPEVETNSKGETKIARKHETLTQIQKTAAMMKTKKTELCNKLLIFDEEKE